MQCTGSKCWPTDVQMSKISNSVKSAYAYSFIVLPLTPVASCDFQESHDWLQVRFSINQSASSESSSLLTFLFLNTNTFYCNFKIIFTMVEQQISLQGRLHHTRHRHLTSQNHENHKKNLCFTLYNPVAYNEDCVVWRKGDLDRPLNVKQDVRT